MRVALLQMCASDQPAQNTQTLVSAAQEAAAQGAELLCTPEVSNCISQSRAHQFEVLSLEEEDQTLSALQDTARDTGLWIALGSVAVKTRDADGRFANRSFVIDPSGQIVARYDKMHMFDVTISETETYRESAGYRPGRQAVLAEAGQAKLGLSICYDLRFPALFRALAKAGAEILLVPSAFAPATGQAHWHTLLRARAIETGSWVIAAAQSGRHRASRGAERQTYGHSLVVAPWGDVLLDAGTETGISVCDIDLEQVRMARSRIPSLTHDQKFEGP